MSELSLRDLLADSDNIVFFGGAGVSTESGIPDFRSADGIYHRQTYRYSPEQMLSRDFFYAHPQEFYDFYRAQIIHTEAKPNPAHSALATLERRGKLKAVITQNIDGLHQAAGSQTVLELHGSVHRNYCLDCRERHPLSLIVESSGLPTCGCGGLVRPDVVLYGEGLDMRTMQRAAQLIREADVLVVGGTSLGVYPAAGLIESYFGNKLVLINRSPTPMDARADLRIEGNVGEELAAAIKD